MVVTEGRTGVHELRRRKGKKLSATRLSKRMPGKRHDGRKTGSAGVRSVPQSTDWLESHSKTREINAKLKEANYKQRSSLLTDVKSSISTFKKTVHLPQKNRQQGTRKKNQKRSRAVPCFEVSKLTGEDVPMEVLMEKKLTSVFEQLSSPFKAIQNPATPMNEKSYFVAKNVSGKNNVSSTSPHDELELKQSEKCITLEKNAGLENQFSNDRDVCYIFALLDKESNEVMFKYSPHLRSSHALQQIALVIENIFSNDNDAMTSFKIIPTALAGDETDSKSDHKIHGMETSSFAFLPEEDKHHQENDQNAQCQSPAKKNDLKKATKIIIAQGLLRFISELKDVSDCSLKFLVRCSRRNRGEIDNDWIENEIETFLAHCHDKVSLLMECLFFLDTAQILNVEQDELERLWLLHDGLCCMMSAYRYIQYSEASPSQTQQLASLLTTCSKKLLPCAGLSVAHWTSQMEVVCKIRQTLCEYEFTLSPCKCSKLYKSLRENRYCRVCDVDCLYQEICKSEEESVFKQSRVEELKHSLSNKTAVEQLFPRYCSFLTSIDEWPVEDFKAALLKHSVVKFSCNGLSGLYPCNRHLSDITCSCFKCDSHLPFEVGYSASNAHVNKNAKSMAPPTNAERPAGQPNHIENEAQMQDARCAQKSVQIQKITANNFLSADHERKGKNSVEQNDRNSRNDEMLSAKCETITLYDEDSSSENFAPCITQSSNGTESLQKYNKTSTESSTIHSRPRSPTKFLLEPRCVSRVTEEEISSSDDGSLRSQLSIKKPLRREKFKKTDTSDVSNDGNSVHEYCQTVGSNKETSTVANAGSITSFEAVEDHTRSAGVMRKRSLSQDSWESTPSYLESNDIIGENSLSDQDIKLNKVSSSRLVCTSKDSNKKNLQDEECSVMESTPSLQCHKLSSKFDFNPKVEKSQALRTQLKWNGLHCSPDVQPGRKPNMLQKMETSRKKDNEMGSRCHLWDDLFACLHEVKKSDNIQSVRWRKEEREFSKESAKEFLLSKGQQMQISEDKQKGISEDAHDHNTFSTGKPDGLSHKHTKKHSKLSLAKKGTIPPDDKSEQSQDHTKMPAEHGSSAKHQSDNMTAETRKNSKTVHDAFKDGCNAQGTNKESDVTERKGNFKRTNDVKVDGEVKKKVKFTVDRDFIEDNKTGKERKTSQKDKEKCAEQKSEGLNPGTSAAPSKKKIKSPENKTKRTAAEAELDEPSNKEDHRKKIGSSSHSSETVDRALGNLKKSRKETVAEAAVTNNDVQENHEAQEQSLPLSKSKGKSASNFQTTISRVKGEKKACLRSANKDNVKPSTPEREEHWKKYLKDLKDKLL